MKKFLRGAILTLLLTSSKAFEDNPGATTLDTAQVLENYSFDFSAHKLPYAYSSYGAAVQLHHRFKLIPDIKSRFGAIVMDRVSDFVMFLTKIIGNPE
jgi:hypothetical protein